MLVTAELTPTRSVWLIAGIAQIANPAHSTLCTASRMRSSDKRQAGRVIPLRTLRRLGPVAALAQPGGQSYIFAA